MKVSFLRFLLISAPIFIILFLQWKPIINIYLGPRWSQSVEYSRYYIIFIFFQFLSSPFSFIFILKKKLQTSLLINLLLLISITISFAISYFAGFSPQKYATCFHYGLLHIIFIDIIRFFQIFKRKHLIMRVAVIVDNYPNSDNLYANGFIHQRVKEYNKHFDCVVLNANTETDYIYDNVVVKSARDINEITTILSVERYDKIIVHFIKWWIIDYLIRINELPTLVWVHGYETLSWSRYHFLFKLTSFFNPQFYRYYVFSNIRQRYFVRKLINHLIKTLVSHLFLFQNG